jgi:hypothetical protein
MVQFSNIARIIIFAFLSVALSPILLHAQEVQGTMTPTIIDLPDHPLPFSFYGQGITPPEGLRIEMSVAPPADNMPRTAYDLGKYGRVAVEYTRITNFDGAYIGLAAQALHVAHHLLFYSFGLTTDVNNDGMFLITTGFAHYQSGNAVWEPFVNAPFMRFRFQAGEEEIYAYSEIETTMHFREYISGMAGLGLRISPVLRMIGGIHHTEFVMPTEHSVRHVDGFQGIICWGM